MSLKIENINDDTGRKLVHDAKMVVVKARTSTEKKAKELNEEATKFTRAINVEKNRIISLLEPIENHLKDEERRISEEEERLKREVERLKQEEEAKRQAKIKAENEHLIKERAKLEEERKAIEAERLVIEAEKARIAKQQVDEAENTQDMISPSVPVNLLHIQSPLRFEIVDREKLLSVAKVVDNIIVGEFDNIESQNAAVKIRVSLNRCAAQIRDIVGKMYFGTEDAYSTGVQKANLN